MRILAIAALVPFLVLTTGCPEGGFALSDAGIGEMTDAGPDDAGPTDPRDPGVIRACEHSHDYRALVDEFERVYRHLDEVARQGRLTAAYLEETRLAFDQRLREVLDAWYRRQWLDHIIGAPTIALRFSENIDRLIAGYEDQLVMCASGPVYVEGDGGANIVEDPCGGSDPLAEAMALQQGMRAIKDTVVAMYRNPPDEFLASISAQSADVLNNIEAVRSNGVVTYLALGCTTSEAFARLFGTPGRGAPARLRFEESPISERSEAEAIAIGPAARPGSREVTEAAI